MLIRFFNRIYGFIQSNKALKWSFYTLLVLYPILFYFLHKRFGLRAIGFHTNIIIPLILIALAEFLHRFKVLSETVFSKIKYFISIYIIIEFILVLIRPPAIYVPFIRGQYYAPYDTRRETYYHNRQPHEEYYLKTPEFKFHRTANSLGLPDYEWDIKKDSNTIRILCLGDSFTEGDGSDMDSSYVAFLRRSLQNKYSNIEVMNAGRCGSDPFFDFELLKDKLIQYQPDIVLQSFTTNDLYYDMLIKGGGERFQEDSTLTYRKNYWWEPIYAASFVSRILIQAVGQMDKYLIRQDEYSIIKKDVEEKSIDLFKKYYEYTTERDINLLVYSLVFKGEKSNSQDNLSFEKKFRKEFKKFGLEFYSLHNCYEKEFINNHFSYKGFFWKKDGHHNAKGYKMMANCIEETLEENSFLQGLTPIEN